MQKILYILTKSGIGGAQKYVADLAKNLDKGKFESKIYFGGKDTCPPTNSNDVINNFEQEKKLIFDPGNICGLDIVKIGGRVKWLSNKTHPWFLFVNDCLAVFELIKIFKKEKPDIVHLNSSKAGVIGAIAAQLFNVTCLPAKALATEGHTSHVTVIFTAHGWVFNPTNEISWLARQFYVLLHKMSAKFQDKIICVSEYDYNLALEYDICEPEKLVKIHNGIDPNIKFLTKKEARKQLSEKLITLNLKLKTNHPWVGSIGRLVKEKNYETFIEAAKSIPNAYFFIIGEGLELEKLNVKCQMLNVVDRFFILSPSGNDAQYLKAFDVFAMSSVKEGLPYILLEAMAAELPIVITEAGGMPELIKNHESGLMVAQKNPEALARAIGGLIENKIIAKELSQKAKEIVKERFSLKEMVKLTEKVYKF